MGKKYGIAKGGEKHWGDWLKGVWSKNGEIIVRIAKRVVQVQRKNVQGREKG